MSWRRPALLLSTVRLKPRRNPLTFQKQVAGRYNKVMRFFLFPALLLLTMAMIPQGSLGQAFRCPPTPADADGPFYRPDAPVRSQIGSGYLLMGQVKSAADCAPIGGARIEIWMAGPDGIYGDQWRATLFARRDGRYHFSSHLPGQYGSRPPHIHLIVNAPGFDELITQHYLRPGAGEAIFDPTMIPAARNRP